MSFAILTGCGTEQSSDTLLKATHISIESGDSKIYPFGCLTWSKKEKWNGKVEETIVDKYDVVDLVSGKTEHSVADIPVISLDGDLSYSIQANGMIENTYLLTQGENGYEKSETTFDALSQLGDGRYYVVLEILLAGNCDPDSPQNSYRYEDVFCLLVGDIDIVFRQYTWDGWGISSKTLPPCNTGYDIVTALNNLEETGEIIPQLSDEELEVDNVPRPSEYYAERGTMWIECNGKIYRLTPDYNQICLVDRHYGEGKVLKLTEELRQDIVDAWNFVPFDYYMGEYNRGDKTVELTNVFEAPSSIGIKIKKIDVSTDDNTSSSITLEVVSTENQEVVIDLDCQMSSDFLGTGDNKTLTLKKNKPQTVTMAFKGVSDFRHWIDIRADNTIVSITINP
ncbi:MAG: hypothetical protein IKU25_08275 [Clostridia bacterium]|nr:hypothetical protein [Clostridia bacterium]